MRPLNILLLSDGRPGSYHLSEGIILAIQLYRPAVTTRLEVRRRGWSGKLLAVLVNAGMPAHWLLKIVHGINADALPPVDLIVSSGAETLAANIALARVLTVPNIFYGSLRWFRRDDFALVLTSYARHANGNRHLMVLKPSSAVADATPRLEVYQLGPSQPPKVAGLLIGGLTRGFVFTEDYWRRLAEFVAMTHKTYGTRWIISNSRRSPAAASDALAAITASIGENGARFIDVRKAGSDTIRPLFQQAEAVVCSADSSTMISEVVSAMLPAVIVTPEQYHFTPEEEAYRRYLIANGWCQKVPILELSPQRFLSELDRIEPLKVNPIKELGATLRDCLPELYQE